jgi:hypothetical protein
MAICSALSGALAKTCELNAGGVNKIFVTDFANVTAYTDGAAGGGQVGNWITGVTSAVDFFEIATNKNVCNFQETVNIDLANGSTFFNQVITLELSRRETTKRTFIEKLIDGQKALLVIILDSNGNYFLAGKSEGAYVTAIDGQTGVAKADRNGYTVTFTAMEPDQAWQIDPAIISTLTTNA